MERVPVGVGSQNRVFCASLPAHGRFPRSAAVPSPAPPASADSRGPPRSAPRTAGRPGGLPRKLPNRPVPVHQVVQGIEVLPRALLRVTRHQDPLQLSAGTPLRVGHSGKDPLFQALEPPGPGRPVGEHGWNPAQHRRKAIPRVFVEIARLDRNPAPLRLRAEGISQGDSREGSRTSGEFPVKPGDSRPKTGFFAVSTIRFRYWSQMEVPFSGGHEFRMVHLPLHGSPHPDQTRPRGSARAPAASADRGVRSCRKGRQG